MKSLFFFAMLIGLIMMSFVPQSPPDTVRLFDGKTFKGWEGDTLHTWRIANGMLIGGSTEKVVPHNDFLCTTRTYANFIMKLKVKLTGTEGFINSGIQFRSKRLVNPPYEMEGYQADWGEGFWGGLYDESRRNKTLIRPDSIQVLSWIKKNDWNDYEIRAEKRHIRLYVNGKQTVDYTEPDTSIPQVGLIGFQIHGGGAAQVAFKDVTLQELP
ncbi:3-keto-disaccharide hydrolase [Emticicia sp. 17c]|uniref:3-keto-disaccharide hydrolase n=1 Tax=Emticicia sp. 17c TaxID=3127704 RepID=UPI00301E2BCE